MINIGKLIGGLKCYVGLHDWEVVKEIHKYELEHLNVGGCGLATSKIIANCFLPPPDSSCIYNNPYIRDRVCMRCKLVDVNIDRLAEEYKNNTNIAAIRKSRAEDIINKHKTQNEK